MSNKYYRLDIQGLRAIAVLSVVFFHIDPNRITGGFIGVDVFFVISGYLIMGHIWRDLKNNTFSLVNFYSKRIRRLFPALVAVLVISSFLAFFTLLPGEFEKYAQSLISSLLYVSNFWFYSKSGYFDSELQSSLLLHTWSLSIEEQFYIIFPILLLIVYKYFRDKVILFLTVVSLISFSYSEFLVNINESLAFYATPSRFWQFIIGGLLSISSVCPPHSKLKREVLSATSLFILLFCIFYFSSSTIFPGLNALLPTIATATIIYSGSSNDFFYKILSNPIANFFGNISYSLYLWHWPIIIFYKLNISPELHGKDKVIVLLTSIFLGYVSYKYIESLTRGIKIEKRSLNPILLTVAVTILMCFTIFLYPKIHRQGFTKEQIDYEAYLNYDISRFRKGKCFLASQSNDFTIYDKNLCINAKKGKYNILLIGDSHAAHWYSALNARLNKNETLTQVNASGCKPTIQYIGKKMCTDLMKWAYTELIQKHKFNKIILSARWTKEDAPSLEKTIILLQNKIQDITVLGPIIEYNQALPRLLAKSTSKEDVLKHAEFARIEINDVAISEAVKSSSKAKYLSILNGMCSSSHMCITSIDSRPVQFDYGHLTHSGAEYVLSKMSI